MSIENTICSKCDQKGQGLTFNAKHLCWGCLQQENARLRELLRECLSDDYINCLNIRECRFDCRGKHDGCKATKLIDKIKMELGE